MKGLRDDSFGYGYHEAYNVQSGVIFMHMRVLSLSDCLCCDWAHFIQISLPCGQNPPVTTWVCRWGGKWRRKTHGAWYSSTQIYSESLNPALDRVEPQWVHQCCLGSLEGPLQELLCVRHQNLQQKVCCKVKDTFVAFDLLFDCFAKSSTLSGACILPSAQHIQKYPLTKSEKSFLEADTMCVMAECIAGEPMS